MANTLTLPNGTPYNVVYENGRAYFAQAVFGNVGANIPSDFRLVPASMVPMSYVTVGGKRYAYVPESQIAAYVNSPSFKNATSNYAGGGTGVSMFIVGDSIRNARAQVLDTINTLDVAKRSSQWASTSGKKTINKPGTLKTSGVEIPKQTQTQPVVPSMGGSGRLDSVSKIPGSKFWSIIQNNAAAIGVAGINADGSYQLQYNQGQTFIIAGPDGVATLKDPTSFAVEISQLDPKSIKQYQKILKQVGLITDPNYKISGIADNIFRNAILQAGNVISGLNYNIFHSNKAGSVNPYTIETGLKYLAKNPGLATGGVGIGAGAGKPTTTTDTVTKAFSITQAEAVDLLEGFYAAAVGRRPNKNEVSAFVDLVNKKAKANPASQTTVTKTNAAGTKQTRTVTEKAGYGETEAALAGRKQAESDPRSHAFLASTKYFDAILAAVRNPQI